MCSKRHVFGRRGGLTLLEILIVISIIVILLSIALPMMSRIAITSQSTGSRTDIERIGAAIHLFDLHCGRLPTTAEGLVVLLDGNGIIGWKGPYLETGVPRDPWDNPYVYTCPGLHNKDAYDLSSFGPDRVAGSSDDVCNWNH